MNQFFQTNLGRLYCDDCLSIMTEMATGLVDLTVTSPPYGKLREYHGYSFNFGKIVKELYRITAPGGVVVWVVGDEIIDGSESGVSFRQALYFMDLGFKLHDTMIYQKNGPTHPEFIRYHQVFEFMFIFSRGKPKTVNLLMDRPNKWPGSWGRTSFRNRDGTLDKRDNKVPYKKFGIRFNIWQINSGYGFTTKDEIAYEHPAIFPEALARDHIRSWSNPGDLVFDPMVGSGTTALEAEKLKRRWIACDVSKVYCKIATHRIKKVWGRLALDLKVAI